MPTPIPVLRKRCQELCDELAEHTGTHPDDVWTDALQHLDAGATDEDNDDAAYGYPREDFEELISAASALRKAELEALGNE